MPNYFEARARYLQALQKRARLMNEIAKAELEIAEALIVLQQAAEDLARSASEGTVDLQEAARILGVSYSTVYQMARSGELPTIRFGRAYRVPKWAIREALSGKHPAAIKAAGAATPARKGV